MCKVVLHYDDIKTTNIELGCIKTFVRTPRIILDDAAIFSIG
jgi:hypothetical protein